MYYERKNIDLLECTFIGPYSFEEQAEEFKKQINEYIKMLKNIYNKLSNFNNLSNEDFYELLCKLYYIQFEEKDYLKMLSKLNNKQYIGIYEIPTSMTFNGIATEKFGRNFDWWKQLYQVYFVVAGSTQFNFNYGKVYSKKDVKELLANKDIVIFKETTKRISNNVNFPKQKYESFVALDVNLENLDDYSSKFIQDNFNLFSEMLRNAFTKKKVLKDLRRFILELNEEIRKVLSYSKSKKFMYYTTATICKEWYNSSEEKNDFQVIQKKLELASKTR